MSLEVVWDTVATDGSNRYLDFSVSEGEFMTLARGLSRARQSWPARELMSFGGFGILSCEHAIEEGMILSPEEFEPSLVALTGAVHMEMLRREFTKCSMTLPTEGHGGRDWLGYVLFSTASKDSFVHISPSLPSLVKAYLPVPLAQDYDGIAVSAEIWSGIKQFAA
jgi:hypothetical protein